MTPDHEHLQQVRDAALNASLAHSCGLEGRDESCPECRLARLLQGDVLDAHTIPVDRTNDRMDPLAESAKVMRPEYEAAARDNAIHVLLDWHAGHGGAPELHTAADALLSPNSRNLNSDGESSSRNAPDLNSAMAYPSDVVGSEDDPRSISQCRDVHVGASPDCVVADGSNSANKIVFPENDFPACPHAGDTYPEWDNCCLCAYEAGKKAATARVRQIVQRLADEFDGYEISGETERAMCVKLGAEALADRIIEGLEGGLSDKEES